MGTRVFGVLVMVAAVSLLAPAGALAYNTRITVYASVPEMRVAYVNNGGFIYKVAGNTARNINPVFYNQENKQIPATDSLNQQYQQFLKVHNYHLQASKIYLVNPVSVNLQPNTQIIKVESLAPELSLGF